MTKRRVLSILLAALFAITAIAACFFTACGEEQIITPKWEFGDGDLIKADGNKLRINYGEGAEIQLRGVNAGGIFVTENWMNAFAYDTYTFNAGTDKAETKSVEDNKTINEVFVDRFGEQKTVELWNAYRSAYWSDIDFANCAAMGINVIRLPFTYMTVDPDYHEVARKSGQKYNFDLLDNFINRAEEFGIYTILDLHGAYGSQNGQDHSGEIMESAKDVKFYGEEGAEDRAKTAALWSAIAEHYKGNPSVAGYDIINEPGEKGGTTSDKHWKVFDQFYDAIREKDADHVVIIESCWSGNNIPRPEDYGWENVMYSFHNYTSYDSSQSHMSNMRGFVSEVESHVFGVPIQMGEFTCYNSESDWQETLELFNTHGWHWTSWTYKITPSSAMPWGVYNIVIDDAHKISPTNDSYETVMEKIEALRTKWNTEEEQRDFANPFEYRSDAFAASYRRTRHYIDDNGGEHFEYAWEKSLAELIYDARWDME